jgi:hypothetical protein
MVTLSAGVVKMDACLNLDPDSPKQADCDHVPRDLAVLVTGYTTPAAETF